MKILLGLVLWSLLVSCSVNSEEQVTISTTPADVSEKSQFLVPSKPLRVKYPFNFLLIAVPLTYKLESKGWTLVAPNGDRIKVTAILTASNGTITKFDHVGFMFGDKKRYLSLSAAPNEQLKNEYVKVQVISSLPFLANEIKWLSTVKY
jgi:hypothetical protein